MIYISDYELESFQGQKLLISPAGIWNVKSKQTWSTLEKLKTIKLPISRENLTALLDSIPKEIPDHSHDILSLLERSGLILERATGLSYQSAELLDNYGLSQSEIEAISSELEKNHIKALIHTGMKPIGKPDYIIYILGSMTLSQFEDYYFKSASDNPELFISVAYFNENTFTISNPYVRSFANPCHFCAVNWHLHYESVSPSHCKWKQLLKFSTTHNLNLQPCTPTLIQRAFVVGHLTRYINSHLSPNAPTRLQDTLMTTDSIDTTTGAIHTETIPHWPNCECLSQKKG